MPHSAPLDDLVGCDDSWTKQPRYFRPKQGLPWRVTLDDPALSIMTDLRQVTTFMAELSTPLDKGLEIMIKREIRILLVCDINGDKPHRILVKAGGVREDLRVSDVMTLRSKLDVLSMEDVRRARVGDLIAILRQADRQHALVLDRDPETGKSAVRGIFSLSQISLWLGLNIDPSRQATLYADFEKAGGTL